MRKWILTVLLLAGGQTALGSALSAAANALAPGSWTTLPTTGLNNALLTDGGAAGILAFCDEASWNAQTSQIRFWGAAEGFSNPINIRGKFIQYDEATNAWTTLTKPVPPFANGSHCYDHTAINPANGIMYRREWASLDVYKYENNAWAYYTSVPGGMIPGFLQIADGFEYFPERGELILVNGGNGSNEGSVVKYTIATNTWSLIASGLAMGPYHTIARYNPILKLIVFGGGDGSGVLYKYDRSGVITQVATCPVQVGITHSIFTVDPITGQYLVLTQDTVFRIFNVVSNTWSVSSNNPPNGFWVVVNSEGPAAAKIATPISNHGVVMFVVYNFDSSIVYLYKHASGGGVTADFTKRCSGLGVTRCFSFDNQTETDPYLINDGQVAPVIDASQKTSGAGSLMFTIPTLSGDAAGSFSTNFSPGTRNCRFLAGGGPNNCPTELYPIQFGAGQEFYIQWRQRFNPAFLSTLYQAVGGSAPCGGNVANGWKQDIIGTGDRTNVSKDSCTALETVAQNTCQRGFAQMYHNCGTFENLVDAFPPSDFKLQNAIPSPFCLYSNNPAGQVNSNSPCAGYQANEWLTFKVHILVGTLSGGSWINSHIDLWMARDGQASVRLLNYGPYSLNAGDGVSDKFGKIWLLPYHTNKSPSQAHSIGFTWYDELIISTLDIADPATSYSTSFPLTENPISESSNWRNGQTDGIVWKNIRTTPGLAFGTQLGTGSYDDSTAVLVGNWPADQHVRGVVRKINPNPAYSQEVALRLRTTINANSLTGYEFLWSVTGNYHQIVRWNGPFGNFTVLSGGGAGGVVDGDVIEAAIIGSTINVYKNGILVGTTTDTTFTTGNPGLGVFIQGASIPGSENSQFGFSSFSADANFTIGDVTAPGKPAGLRKIGMIDWFNIAELLRWPRLY